MIHTITYIIMPKPELRMLITQLDSTTFPSEQETFALKALLHTHIWQNEEPDQSTLSREDYHSAMKSIFVAFFHHIVLSSLLRKYLFDQTLSRIDTFDRWWEMVSFTMIEFIDVRDVINELVYRNVPDVEEIVWPMRLTDLQ